MVFVNLKTIRKPYNTTFWRTCVIKQIQIGRDFLWKSLTLTPQIKTIDNGLRGGCP